MAIFKSAAKQLAKQVTKGKAKKKPSGRKQKLTKKPIKASKKPAVKRRRANVEDFYNVEFDLKARGMTPAQREKLAKEMAFDDIIYGHLTKPIDKNYDLIHIDGSHIYEDKVHDLKLTLGRCNVVVIDDYDFIDDTKKAVDEFIDLNRKYILNVTHVKSFRGTMVIEYKNAY